MNTENQSKELALLKSKLDDPSYYSTKEYPKTAKRISELEEIIKTSDSISGLRSSLVEAKELAKGNDELAELAKIEIDESEAKIEELTVKLQELLIPKDPNAEKDCIVEIRGGAGGDEAALFAGELYIQNRIVKR